MELVSGTYCSKRDEKGREVEHKSYAYMASPSMLWDEDLIAWAERREAKLKERKK